MQLNFPVCAENFGNTGFGDCYLDLKKIKGAIKVPSDFVITKEDLPDLQEFLLDAIHADSSFRILPYHNFIGMTDSTEDIQIETTDYGAKFKTRDGDYDLTFRYKKGGVQLHQEISKNEGDGSYLYYDENNVLIGYRTKAGLMGIPSTFWPLPWKFAGGSTSTQLLLRFTFESIYLNKGNLGFIQVTDFNLFDVKGLQDVDIELVNLVANVATVRLLTRISGVNMYSRYSTNLAATAAFEAYDQDGEPVDITTVAANSTTEKTFDITFDTGDFNAADKVFLKGAAAEVWKATPISVEGFEAKDALEIEAPAS